MSLKFLHRTKEQVNMSQVSSEIEEAVPTEEAGLIESRDTLERHVNLDNFETDKIYLMDISTDNQWICYVSQYEHTTDEFTNTLSIRKFSAINDKTSKEEYLTSIFKNDSSFLHESRVHMEDNSESSLRSICVNEYFNKTNIGHKFLSISPNGQYITLSTYNEDSKDAEGGCIIFKVHKTKIWFHCELKCNGRAVFLNRENELCLAIINTETLKIYQNISNFAKNMPYDLYDLTPFGVSYTDHANSKSQYLHTDFVSSWAVSKTPNRIYRSYSIKMQHIIAMSTFIKDNILLSPFTGKSNTIRFWSLNNNGVLLASIVAPKEAVIAISQDFKYAATTSTRVFGTKTVYVVNVYNLENGCLAYKLKSQVPIDRITHATFCYNSRYLALSAVQWNSELKNLEDRSLAVFEVWYIEREKLIYTGTRSLGQNIPGSFNLERTQVKLLKPFIVEERVKNDRPVLKGFHFHTDQEGIEVITKCFELEIDDQSNIAVEWLIEDDVFPEEDMDISFYLGNLETLGDYGSDDPPEFKINKSLDKLLNTYFSTNDDRHFEIIDHMKLTERLKCGLIKTENGKFLVRCGNHMIQLWQLVEDLTDEENRNMQSHRLVYIKPHTNSDYRSFYLSANIWRIESFESMKIIGNLASPRVILNIIEDHRYFRQRRTQLTPYTEELILPISGDDNNIFNYHVLEGACQTLYFLNVFYIEENGIPFLTGTKTETVYERQLEVLYKKTMMLIESEIDKMDKNCTAFKSAPGSKTLAMLASFQRGRDVLKLLLKNEEVIFNISSYNVTTIYGSDTVNLSEIDRYSTSEFKFQWENSKSQSITDEDLKNQTTNVMAESVLTVLIREREYHLYHLIFNRILSDSKKSGPECLSILHDALLLLQEVRDTDNYEKSSQKLSYLPVGNGVLLPFEIPSEIPYKADIQDDLIANIGNMFFFSAMEQISQSHTQKLNYFRIKDVLSRFYFIAINIWVAIKSLCGNINIFRDTHKKSSNQFVTCVVPLPHFNTYYFTTVRDAFLNSSKASRKGKNSVQSAYKKESTFLFLALNQHGEPNIWRQGGDIMAILLQYKWRAFIQARFFLICIVYLVYYITYSTGVQFALEMYSYDSTSEDRSIANNAQHVTSLALFFISGTTLLLLEFYQLPKDQTYIYYFRSWYNYVDLAAVLLPFMTFLQLILNWNYFYEISSVCTLILWLHGIIRLRVFSSFGITLEIIIQLFRKVSSVLFILLIVVFGFTHSFIVLLRQQDDQYFQDNYGGETSISLNDVSSTSGETVLFDLSSSNGFADPFKAFYQVWLFIFGVWDPVTSGDSGDNQMLFVLCMIFAFIAVLIFTNMIIALMSSTVEEVKQRGKKVWMTHFAAVIAEIEDLTSKSTKHNRLNNPAFIFYFGNAEKVRRQEETLRLETQELRKILMMDEVEQIKVTDELKHSTQSNTSFHDKTLEQLKRENAINNITINEIKNEIQKLCQLLESTPKYNKKK